jgi:hypothetical protein
MSVEAARVIIDALRVLKEAVRVIYRGRESDFDAVVMLDEAVREIMEVLRELEAVRVIWRRHRTFLYTALFKGT